MQAILKLKSVHDSSVQFHLSNTERCESQSKIFEIKKCSILTQRDKAHFSLQAALK